MQGLEKLPRRSLLGLVTAGVASAVAGLHISPVRAGKDDDERTVSREIEGTWLETYTTNLPPPFDKPFPTLITFARGGGLVTITTNIAPAQGHMSLGTWAKIGPHQYTHTFMGLFFNPDGVFNVWVKVHATSLRVERDGHSYNSEGWAQQLDTQFNVLGQVSFISHATRIDAQ